MLILSRKISVNYTAFFEDLEIGMVQTRWEHLNRSYSMVTQIQALALDGHFVIEQQVRNKAHCINFNGTSGIWRKECISIQATGKPIH
jgi:hypothetical protein